MARLFFRDVLVLHSILTCSVSLKCDISVSPVGRLGKTPKMPRILAPFFMGSAPDTQATIRVRAVLTRPTPGLALACSRLTVEMLRAWQYSAQVGEYKIFRCL